MSRRNEGVNRIQSGGLPWGGHGYQKRWYYSWRCSQKSREEVAKLSPCQSSASGSRCLKPLGDKVQRILGSIVLWGGPVSTVREEMGVSFWEPISKRATKVAMMEQEESLKEDLVNPLYTHLKTETKESCLMEEEEHMSIRGDFLPYWLDWEPKILLFPGR